MRTFIAIELPIGVREQLMEMIGELKPQFPRRVVRWVRREQLHLTLAFLGEMAVSQLPALQQALDQCANQHEPFQLQLGEMGCFPNCRRPKVLWIGLAGEMERLKGLQRQVAQAIESLGWKRDKRPFRPHLTLGRIKDNRRLSWHKVNSSTSVRFEVNQIHLIESKLRPTGAIYTIRHSSGLLRHE